MKFKRYIWYSKFFLEAFSSYLITIKIYNQIKLCPIIRFELWDDPKLLTQSATKKLNDCQVFTLWNYNYISNYKALLSLTNEDLSYSINVFSMFV